MKQDIEPVWGGLLGKLGLDSRVLALRCGPEQSRLHQLSCVAAQAGPVGSGISSRFERAVHSSIGEGLERICLQRPNGSLVLKGDKDFRPDLCLSERDFPTFTAEQVAQDGFPYTPYSPDSVSEWARAKRIGGTSGESETFIPAAMAWVRRFDSCRFPAVSSGASVHFDEEAARLGGICEVIERDAFSIVWETRARTPEIDPFAPWQDAEVGRIQRHFEIRGMELILRDLTTDLGVPVVLCVILDRIRRPALSLGAACRPSYREACLKAAVEAFHTWAWMSEEHSKGLANEQEAASALQVPSDMYWHPYFYGFHSNLDLASHLIERSAFSDPPLELIQSQVEGTFDSPSLSILRVLGAKGLKVYMVDIALPEMAERGLHAIKFFIPGLVQLSIGRWGRYLANSRYRTVPIERNWQTGGMLGPSDGIPHPFP